MVKFVISDYENARGERRATINVDHETLVELGNGELDAELSKAAKAIAKRKNAGGEGFRVDYVDEDEAAEA